MLAPLLDGAIVVGSNPAFDRDFLRPFLRRHGQAYTCHYWPVCVRTMAARFLVGQRAGYGISWNALAHEVRSTAKFHPKWPMDRPKIFEQGEGLSLVPMPHLPWSSGDVAGCVGIDARPPCPPDSVRRRPPLPPLSTPVHGSLLLPDRRWPGPEPTRRSRLYRTHRSPRRRQGTP